MTAIPLGALLATDAADASRPAGPCALCDRGIITGDRFARLPDGKLSHTQCIGNAARFGLLDVTGGQAA